MRRMCSGRRAAAAADDVEQAGPRELAADRRAMISGRVVEAAEGVGQAGVRVAAEKKTGAMLRQLLDVRPHLLRARARS